MDVSSIGTNAMIATSGALKATATTTPNSVAARLYAGAVEATPMTTLEMRRGGEKASDADKRALRRCVSEEKDARVAGRCARPPSPTKPEATRGDVAVYVVPDGRRAPEARAPFALVRADGIGPGDCAMGSRPNSPPHTTRVLLSSPLCFRSESNAPIGLSVFWQQ